MLTRREVDEFLSTYKKTYNSLGDDRPQEGVPILPREPPKWKKGQVNTWSEFDTYWKFRRDSKWNKLPGKLMRNRRTQQSRFICSVPSILMRIAPSELFNPCDLWLAEKERVLRADEQSADVRAVARSQEEIDREFLEDCEKIRAFTNQDREASLVHFLLEMRSRQARFVLLVEILKNAEALNLIALALEDVDKMLPWFEALPDEEKRRFKLIGKRAEGANLRETLAFDSGWADKKEGVAIMIEKKRAKATNVINNVKAKALDEFKGDILQIRKTKAKNDLMSILKKMHSAETRLVLMVEMLCQATEPRNAKGEIDKSQIHWEHVFDIHWAVEDLLQKHPDLKTREFAPDLMEHDRSVPEIVYDKFSDVEKLLKKIEKERSRIPDPIKMQLVNMYDRLPPLSKFTHGLRLDSWQKRVLSWIDAGRSSIICAPTSSGKTVLSSYAALLPKGYDAAKGGAASAAAAPAAGATSLDLAEGDDVEVDDAEFDAYDEEETDDDEDADENAEDKVNNANAREDKKSRLRLLSIASKFKLNRVLFVVPTEPLAWQVGAYFSRLLHKEGDRSTNVAIVTDQMVFHPLKKFDAMPQIVVGTPIALEIELTKCRGRVGEQDFYGIARGDSVPGGFDHFDWVIYDEVHSLDGEAGHALQRLIRAMHCKFLALSATVGNAEELRGWMESVRGEQLDVEELTVEAAEVGPRVVEAAMPPAMQEVALRQSMAALSTSAAAGAAATPAPTVKIVVRKTQDEGDELVINFLPLSSTVKELKEVISHSWIRRADPGSDSAGAVLQDDDMAADQMQLFNNDPRAADSQAKDLVDNKLTLADYGFKANETNDVWVYRHVNLITHSSRFINLQRYVWNQPADRSKAGELKTLSPLAAVESVESLASGILESSSLSFTSKDSYTLWEKLKKLYPREAVLAVDPDVYFETEKNDLKKRISLQRTKEYEDLMKKTLRTLSTSYPLETQELLHHFSLKDPESTKLDITELVLDLKKRDLQPCLPFHLNSFEAIKLFKSLLHGLEKRQKSAHPNFYTEQEKQKNLAANANDKAIQNTGRNKKELEDAMKRGDVSSVAVGREVDLFEPHPDFLAGHRAPLPTELDRIAKEMEEYDGFRGWRSKEGTQIHAVKAHALMRGLRRGIGLFIKEVSFPAYRRAVMSLASKGDLPVVISDDSLAFGVNMPFRTCVFCGEMIDHESGVARLTPLMAQQMSGRAGRRGLDQQGNLVYVASRANKVRSLMIGKVSHITGRDFKGDVIQPAYPALLVQAMLSKRYVGAGRCSTIGRETLNEYVVRYQHNVAHPDERKSAPSSAESYLFTRSIPLMQGLGFVVEDESAVGKFEPAYRGPTFSGKCLLTLLWVLRDFGHQALTLGLLFKDMKDFLEREIGEAIADNTKMPEQQNRFYAMLLVLIDRHAAKNEESSMRAHWYFKQADRLELLEQWEHNFAEAQNRLRALPGSESLLDPVQYLQDPAKPAGIELDSTMFACLLDKNLCHTLSDDAKQNLKDRLWNVGQIIKHIHNVVWPYPDMHDVFTKVTTNCFEAVKTLNIELIQKYVDFDNVSDKGYERRVEVTVKAEVAVLNAQDLPGDMWTDFPSAGAQAEGHTAAPALGDSDSGIVPAVSYSHTMRRIAERLVLARIGGAAAAAEEEDAREMLRAFEETSKSLAGDVSLVRLLADYPAPPSTIAEFQTFCKRLGTACKLSFPRGGKNEQHTIAMVSWFIAAMRPAFQNFSIKTVKINFANFLQMLYSNEVLTEEGIKEWFNNRDHGVLARFWPSGAFESETQTAAAIQTLKDGGVAELIAGLDEAEEEGSGEEEEDE